MESGENLARSLSDHRRNQGEGRSRFQIVNPFRETSREGIVQPKYIGFGTFPANHSLKWNVWRNHRQIQPKSVRSATMIRAFPLIPVLSSSGWASKSTIA